jgi:hypothetical protein
VDDGAPDCICGDAFADERDYPGEVHYWSCPARVRKAGHSSYRNCIAVNEKVWRTILEALREHDIAVFDDLGRSITDQPEDWPHCA